MKKNQSSWAWVVFLLGIVPCLTADARLFYVDSVGGNDSWNGLSDADAWKTIHKVDISHFLPGDSILFKRGGTWRETLLVNATSGNASSRIVFGAYGDGNRPIITGSDPVTGWTETASGSHIWRANLPWTPIEKAPTPDLVFFDGERGVHMGSVVELAASGSWYWTLDILYVYSISLPGDIQVAARDYCVQGVWNGNSDYITIESLELKNANHQTLFVFPTNDNWIIRDVVLHHAGRLDPPSHNAIDKMGLSMISGYNHLVTQCVVYESGGNNINVIDCSNAIVEKCISYNAHHHCIDIKGGPSSPTGNIVRYNTVYATPGFTENINGIVLITDSSWPNLMNPKVYGNVVYDLTWNGLFLSGTTLVNSQIYNNTVTNCRQYNFYLDDGTCNTTLKNNIGMTNSVPTWSPVLKMASATNKVIDYNCWLHMPLGSDAIQVGSTTYQTLTGYSTASGFDTHAVGGDPLFANAALRDYHLQVASPCIDAGTDAGILFDFDAIPIPQGIGPDIGAYEFFEPLAISLQPISGQTNAGESFTFFTQATGGIGVLSYQWYKDGSLLLDATEAALVMDSVSIEDQGDYAVVVTDETHASVTSDTVTLVVNLAPLTILLQPKSGQANAGESFTFFIQATGGVGVLSYQWYKDGNLILDATEAALVMDSVSIENQGDYAVVVADETEASVTSDTVTLVVNLVPLPAASVSALILLAFMLAASTAGCFKRRCP